MKTIKSDISNKTFHKVYLLCGSEGYLKTLYRNKLKEGVLDGGDEMNYSGFEGKGIDETEVIHICETMPFFADHRVVIIENSGWFKSANNFADALPELPDTTVIVFVETEVDKRNRLYKAVKEQGYICELDALQERDLKLWIASYLKAADRKVQESTIDYLMEKVGTDMENLRTELEKLIAYTEGRDAIVSGDVDAICCELVSGKIFQLVDQVALGNTEKALKLYHDLLVVREKPMMILFHMLRHFNNLLLVKQYVNSGMAGSAIAKEIGVPPFAVGKYQSQAKAFSVQLLREAVKEGVELETMVKTGQMNEQIAVEIMLVKFTTL